MLNLKLDVFIFIFILAVNLLKNKRPRCWRAGRSGAESDPDENRKRGEFLLCGGTETKNDG